MHVGVVETELETVFHFPAGGFVLRSRVVIVFHNLVDLQMDQMCFKLCVYSHIYISQFD